MIVKINNNNNVAFMLSNCVNEKKCVYVFKSSVGVGL